VPVVGTAPGTTTFTVPARWRARFAFVRVFLYDTLVTIADVPTLRTALRHRWAIWNALHDARVTDPTRAVEHALTGGGARDPYSRLWDYMFLSTERPARRIMSGFLVDDLALRCWADLTLRCWADLTDAVREAYMTTDWSRQEDRAALDNIIAAAVETAARRRQEPRSA
jgi:hypothetical protein